MNIESIHTIKDSSILEETSEQLRISEARYRRLFESSRQGILIMDAATRKIIDANPSLAQLTGYTYEEMTGKELKEIGFFADPVGIDAAFQELEEFGYLSVRHLSLQTKDGERRDVELTGNLYEENGHTVIQCSVHDITGHKQAREIRDTASHEIISIWESMTDAFYSLDRNWRFTYVNSQATIQLQRSQEEILGANIWDAFPETVGTSLEREYKRAAAEQIQVSFEEFYVPLQSWFIIHVYPSNTGLSVYFRDITEQKRAEAIRRESDAQLRTLVESIPQIVWMSQPDGRELFFNQKWFSFTGLKYEERPHGGWANAIYVDERDLVIQNWKQSVQSGEPFEMEFRLRRVDGAYRWMLGRAISLRDAEGQSTRWFGTATDIHDLKLAKEALQRSEHEQRLLVAQLATEQARLVAAQSVAKVGSWEIDFSAKRETWSAETYRILEVEPFDFQPHDQAFLQFVHPDDRELMSQVMESSLGQRTPCTQEHRLLMPDGRVKVVEQRWQIFHDEQGKPLHAIGTTQDITERKQAQQELEAKTREITAIWESMTDALLTLDVDGNITHINSQATTILHRSQEQLQGENIWKAFPDAVDTVFYEAYQRAVNEQVKVDFEAVYAPLGIWLDVHVYPSQLGLSVYFRDITERKHAQEALQRSEQSLMRAQRIAQLGYMEKDLIAGTESWSEEVFRILGYEPYSLESLRGKVKQHLHPDDQELALQAANKLFAEGTPFNIEHRILRTSGEVRWVQAQAETLKDEKGQIIQFSCTWLDITKRKQAEAALQKINDELETRVEQRTTEIQQANEALRVEGIERAIAMDALKSSSEALRESQQRLQVVMNHIPQAIFWKDRNFTYLGCNYRLAIDAGYDSPEELIGKTDFDMPWAKLAAEYQADDRQIIETGIAKLNVEEQLQIADGSNVWLRTNKIPLHDSERNVVGVLCSYEDITEQKQTETSLIEAREEADAANCAKSEFLSRMSHELRTPLNAILGFGQILNRQPLSAFQLESVGYILKGGNHLLSLINEVLDIARIEAGHIELSLEPVALDEVMEEVCALVRPLADQRGIRLTNSLAMSSRQYVMADQQRLKQVVINLLSNAIKYNREGGQVVVSTTQASNGRVQLRVLDSGHGISSEGLQKLFVPFERLNAADLQMKVLAWAWYYQNESSPR